MADSTALGDLLSGAAGHPVDRQGLNAVVQQGQALSGLRTAQTEDALANAQRMREESDAGDELESALTNMTGPDGKPVMPPSVAHFTATQMKFTHGGAQAALQAYQEAQKAGAFSNVNNPNADPAQRLASDQALNPGANPYQTVGDQVIPRFAPAGPNAAPPVMQTPVSDANVADKNADVALKTAQANNPALFHPTGGNNPNAGKGAMGAILQRYAGATGTAAEQLGIEMHNMLQIPWGADTGVLGTGFGSTHGQDLLSTPVSALRNTMSSQDTQLYSQSASNIGRFIATLEKGGRPVTQTEGDAAAAAFTMHPGDTYLTRLQKMASLSQHAQASVDSYLKFFGNELDADQIKYFKDLKNNFATSIPFDLDDVAALRKAVGSGQLDNHTVGQFFVKHSMGTIPPNLTQPSAAPVSAAPAAGGPTDFSHFWGGGAPQ